MNAFLQHLDDFMQELLVQLTRIADALDRLATVAEDEADQ